MLRVSWFRNGVKISEETRETPALTDAERAELDARAKKAWPENVPPLSGCCDRIE